ncbi:S41 family peptidase [Taibaiella koreensis]|uniref:S41 family peptidase n=1 Tax=Taibaiella koreensis TaxID=1268548 RepID=UPI000E59CB33|nr:S41 family peptidase [Taibaiella koreensis]
MKKIGFIIVLLAAGLTVRGQQFKSKLSADQRRQEVILLQKSLVSLHPGLYRYHTPGEIDNYFNELQQKVSGAITDQAYFILLSQLATKIKCGHTYLNPWNQKRDVINDYFSTSYIPFLYRVVDKKFIITHNLSEHPGVREGDEMISINGIAVQAIFDSLWTVSRSDGNNGQGKKSDNMNIVPIDIDTGNYAMFDIFFPLFFPQNFDAASYRIEIRSAKGKRGIITARSLSKKEREQVYVSRFGKIPMHEENWAFRLLNPETAYFRIGDFETWDWKTDYKGYLDSVFKVLTRDHTPNLVIDIRGNEGGDDEARDELLSYIIDKPFGCENPTRRLYRFLSIPDTLMPYLRTWEKEAKQPKKATEYTKTAEGFYEKNEAIQKPCRPVDPKPGVFKGKVFLIVNSNNSSTTFTLADIVQVNRRGKIIGEQTGGTKQGLNGGKFLLLNLPYSKIEMDIPIIWQAPTTARQDEGIVPDYVVPETQKDIARRHDAQLSFILNLISKQKTQHK